jgi:hypothetical protein
LCGFGKPLVQDVEAQSPSMKSRRWRALVSGALSNGHHQAAETLCGAPASVKTSAPVHV